MSIGQALRQAREGKGQRQVDLAADIYVSDKTISAYESGTRRIPRQLTPALVNRLDDARLAMAAAEEITGGMTAPVLDGPRVDLHRVTTVDRVLEELREAFDALEAARKVVTRARSASELDEAGRALVEEALHQMVQAETAIANGIAVLTEAFGISPKALYLRHRQQLALKGYITKEKARKTA